MPLKLFYWNVSNVLNLLNALNSLLALADVSTTMVYTHVLNRGGRVGIGALGIGVRPEY
jgi:hypothetical protein